MQANDYKTLLFENCFSFASFFCSCKVADPMGLWNSKEIQLEVVRRPRSASIKPFATAEVDSPINLSSHQEN
ncbi:putative transcription factor [Frankliniella fusca]|uniref:Transcription factor n=1 Tax=Frankliniella fusca TaxID=407009 RepID=A0AAE1HI31_9NEOP|nr:putative transcription factor [Frankliniella fusca]KAK3929576.1 putative transcription factor [Frankliniella fusca]